MPEIGGPSTQSGILYQNTVAVEFLVKLLLKEEQINRVQIESLEPIGDIVLHIRERPSIYIQVKENAPRGIWTAAKLDRVKFWQYAKRQITSNPNAQIWLITSTATNIIRELTDRCRRATDENEFESFVYKYSSFHHEFERICGYLKLGYDASRELLKHVYIKDSFGSIEAITQRVKNRLSGTKGENLFAVLRDEIAKGASNRQTFTYDNVIAVLKDHGLIPFKHVEKRLYTHDLKGISDFCLGLIQDKITNIIGEKYLSNLYVKRDLENKVGSFMFKSQLGVIKLLEKLQKTINTYKDNLRFYASYPFLETKEADIYEKYQALLDKVQTIITQLNRGNQVNWNSTKLEVENMISSLGHPQGGELINDFRKAINNVTIIVDKAGRGKTNVLCQLAITWCRENIVALFFGSELILTDKLTLLREIGKSLGFANDIGYDEWFYVLDDNLKSQGKYLVVIVDAVNENAQSELLRKNLEEVAKLTRDHNIRVIISCRDVHWLGYFYVKNDLLDQYIASITDLGDFTEQEFIKVWPKYRSHFHIAVQELSEEAKSALRHPLLLRFFCEAYGNKFGSYCNLGRVTHIRLKKLFDDYWAKKCEFIRIKVKHRNSREINEFLMFLARYMLANTSRTISLNQVTQITGESDLQDKKSKYVAILDEDVIIEQSFIGQGPIVAFVYDEFMEYMMAQAVIQDLPINNYPKLIQRLSGFLRKNRKFPSILGVIGYISIILKEEMSVQVWEPLVDKYPKWHLTATRALGQIDERQWDQTMFSSLRKVTEVLCSKLEAEEILQKESLNILERVTVSNPGDCICIWNVWLFNGPRVPRCHAADELFMLAKGGHPEALSCLERALTIGSEVISATSAYALGKIQSEYVPRLLARQSSHQSPLVREAVAYSLGLFYPCVDVRLTLFELLHDSDSNVRYMSAISLLHDPNENIPLALNKQDDWLINYEPGESRLMHRMTSLWQQLHNKTDVDLKSLDSLIDKRFGNDILQTIRIFKEQIETCPKTEEIGILKIIDYLIHRAETRGL